MIGQTEKMEEGVVPVSGVYELLNVLGSRTGIQAQLERGKRFPPVPRLQEWVLLRADEPGK